MQKKFITLLMVVMLVLSVMLVSILLLRGNNDQASAGAGKIAAATHAGSAVTPLTSTAKPAPVIDASPAPADVPAEEWQRLKVALAATPDGQRQLLRVGEYLTFKHRAEKWRQSKDVGADAASRAELTQYLLDEVSTHVARRELTAGEAQLMVIALLQDRISEPSQLKRAVQEQMAKIQAAQPIADPQLKAQEQARMAAYQQREAAIVAQWQAMPETQRSQQWLESRLDQARQQTLTMPSAP